MSTSQTLRCAERSDLHRRRKGLIQRARGLEVNMVYVSLALAKLSKVLHAYCTSVRTYLSILFEYGSMPTGKERLVSARLHEVDVLLFIVPVSM